jgi:predicted transcriptional regulator
MEVLAMDLQETVMDVLRASGQVLTFEEVLKGIAEKLEGDVRTTLNGLVDKKEITRHVGGRDHPWRYQAVPMRRRF